MVIGGNNGGDLEVVEVIDLDDPNKTCDVIANYPIPCDFLTVTLINGVVKACGGDGSEDCYDFDPASNTWDSSPGLHLDEHIARSSIIDGVWLVSGDGAVPDGNVTEFWNGSEFILGPTPPERMGAHCQVSINATHVFFAHCETRNTYLLDRNLQQWTTLDSMSVDRGYDCECGLINNEQLGKDVVVASYGTSEIFNFANMTWRNGPTLPFGDSSASVELLDTFLLVGGYEDSVSNKMYIFDEANYEFILKCRDCGILEKTQEL